jgi:hypothetical protein
MQYPLDNGFLQLFIAITKNFENIQLFQLRLAPEQSGKVEYERERLLGIANKFIHLLAIPSSLSRSYCLSALLGGQL